MPIMHAVWPIEAPPVCTAFWDQDSWERFEDRYRPADYTGGRYDAEAWLQFRRKTHQKNLAEFLARHGVDPALAEGVEP